MICILYYWTTNNAQFTFLNPPVQIDESNIYERAAKHREAWIMEDSNLVREGIKQSLTRFKRKIESICKVELNVLTGETTRTTLWKLEQK